MSPLLFQAIKIFKTLEAFVTSLISQTHFVLRMCFYPLKFPRQCPTFSSSAYKPFRYSLSSSSEGNKYTCFLFSSCVAKLHTYVTQGVQYKSCDHKCA